MFARVHVPRRRPLRLGVPYHDAVSAANAEKQANAMLKHLLELGDAAVAMGDWNRLKEEPPLSTALAKGVFRDADDAAPHEVKHTGPKRVIDYALTANGAPPALERRQVAGVADHDLVYWDFELGEVESVLRRAPRKPLGKKEVSQALWDERLAARQEELAAAETAGDAAAELCLVLDAAEEALTGQDFVARPGLPRRTRPRRPVKAPLASTRADRLQSATERSLRSWRDALRKTEGRP